MSCFLEQYTGSKNKIKVQLDLSDYVTKSDLENLTDLSKSKLARKTDLASLKLDIDKLDVDKLERVPSSLEKKSRQFGCW